MRTAKARKSARRPGEPAKCTLQELDDGYILTTKQLKKTSPKKPVPPPQNPPQGEYLADEYVHNLQQQLYFLDAEIRFVKDRAGVEPNQDGPSIDASIRRLRRAIAMYEEETNKKIAQIQKETKQLNKEENEVDEAAAVDNLTQANKFEQDELQKHEIAYVESASPINLRQVQFDHSKVMTEFNNQQQQVLDQSVQEQKALRDQQESDISNTQVAIIEIRDQRKALIQQIKDAYAQKYKAMEDKDLMQILEEEPDYKMPNVPADNFKSRNAKVQMEIQSIKQSKKEVKQQIAELLMKNAKLQGDLNILKAKAERGRAIKKKMEKNFNDALDKAKKENDDQKALIEQLRQKKRDIKAKIKESAEECNKQFNILNNIEAESGLLKGTIEFKKSQIDEIEKQNEITTKEIADISNNIEDVRLNLDQLATTIGEAEEKMKQLESRVESNSKDPRCSKLNLPKELEALLDNLTAVKQQIQE